MFDCHYCDLQFYDSMDRYLHEKDVHADTRGTQAT